MEPVLGPQRVGFDLFAVPALLVSFLFLAFVVAARTSDPLMSMQAWTFMAGVGGTIIWLVRRYAGGIPADDTSPYANDVVKESWWMQGR